MMDSSDSSSLHFSEDDIRYQLELLGYQNVPRHQLQQFAADLERLIANDSIQQRDYDEEESAVSDSTSNAEHQSTHAGRDRIQHATDVYGGPSYKAQAPAYRDHTVYGKENQTHRDLETVRPTSYNPRDDVTRQDAVLETSVASSRSEEPPRRPWWPPPEKKPPMKRKVLRKKDGQSQIFDESITESEVGSDDISYLNDRLHEIPMPSHETDSMLAESDTSSSIMYSTGSGRRKPVSANSLYSHRPSGDEDGVFKPHLPRSFIRPSSAPPRARQKHDPKTDPVSRHQMYQAAWKSYKAPGEKSRKDLRWSVREQMMYKDELPKPQTQPRVYVPNTYKVPTEKKRQALRWAVRTTLAQKQKPSYSAFEF